MPKGQNGEKRPADLIGRAVQVAKIATRKIEDEKNKEPKEVMAIRAGGLARAKNLGPKRRSIITQIGARKPWSKATGVRKQIPFLIAFLLIASCSKSPGQQDAGISNPLAFDQNYSASLPEALTDSSSVLIASFEGTRIRITNTSGGNRIAANKLIIFHADWNVNAWHQQDSLSQHLDVTSMDWDRYIKDHIKLRMYCADVSDSVGRANFIQMDTGGTNVLRSDLFALEGRAGQYYPPRDSDDNWSLPSSFENCEDLRVSIEDIARSFSQRLQDGSHVERTTGGRLDIRDDSIALSGVELFVAPRLSITYHPIVSDSSQIAREKLWLETIINEREGFVEAIDRALPVDAVRNHGYAFFGPHQDVFAVGAPVLVPVDSVNCNDGLSEAYRVLSQLHSTLSENDMTEDSLVELRVGILSERVGESYCSFHSGGLASLGGSVSVIGYESEGIYRSNDFSTLIHELGHNLGLGHTPTFNNPDISSPALDYPLPSGLIDLDGYLVRGTGFGLEVHVWNAESTFDFMTYDAPTWVSNYNWNKMLDFINESDDPVSARVLAESDDLIRWECEW